MADCLSGDVFDIRQVIERYEELETAYEAATDEDDPDREPESEDDKTEREEIAAFLEEVKGNGGDHKWRGDWYPCGFIADSHFEDYARELADDIGAIKQDAGWPNSCIDWEKAATELQQDYSSVEIDGETYWYR